MNGKTILIILGGVVLVIAIALVALLLPVQKSAEPMAEEQTTIEPTQEVVMEPTNTAKQAASLSTEQTTTTVTFPTTDNLTVTADLYWTGDANAAFILLFHQAD